MWQTTLVIRRKELSQGGPLRTYRTAVRQLRLIQGREMLRPCSQSLPYSFIAQTCPLPGLWQGAQLWGGLLQSCCLRLLLRTRTSDTAS